MPYALSSFYFTFYILLFVLHVRFHNKYIGMADFIFYAPVQFGCFIYLIV